jgi:dihydroflavonol-4-reductase
MESEVYREAASGLPVNILNPTLVLGPGDVHAVFGDFFELASRGLAAFWIPARVNVVDVRDVARAHVQAAETGRLGERYLLGGHNLTLHVLVDSINQVVGRPPARIRLPDAVVDVAVALSGLTPALAFAGNHLRTLRRWPAYDSSKAERELGLKARPLKETLHDAFEWYQSRGGERPTTDMV